MRIWRPASNLKSHQRASAEEGRLGYHPPVRQAGRHDDPPHGRVDLGIGLRVICSGSHPGPLPATEIIAPRPTLPHLACAGVAAHARARQGRSSPGGGFAPEPRAPSSPPLLFTGGPARATKQPRGASADATRDLKLDSDKAGPPMCGAPRTGAAKGGSLTAPPLSGADSDWTHRGPRCRPDRARDRPG